MIKVALTALAMASVVFAQSTTGSASASSSASTPQSSNIPTGAQPRCKTFLDALDRDTTINKCLNDLIGATDAFDPTGANATASTVNGTAIQQALNTICSPSFTSCPPAAIRTSLTNFYTECSSDLLGPTGDGSDGNPGVIQIYDVLYLILPLKTAICTKVDGTYCLNNSTSSLSSTSSSVSSSSSAPAPSASSAKRATGLVAADLFKRAENTNVLLGRQASNSTQEQLEPSADSYRNSGLPYLFLQPDSSDICSMCTYNIIKGYITFETVTPYAIGIAHSPMLKGQLALWEKIKTCPNNFAANLLNDATGTAAATSGASRMAFGSAVVGVVSVVGVAVAALL